LTGGVKRRRPSSFRLYALISLMILLWSLNFTIGKIALREIEPLLLSALRTALAALFILPVYLWKVQTEKRRVEAEGPECLPRARQPWDRSELRMLILLGVFGVALNQVFFVLGLGNTSVAHASVLMGMTPVQVLLLAAARKQERITLRKLLGMIIAIGGVAWLNTSPGRGANASLVGDGFILLASFAFAVFTVAGKSVTKRHDSNTVNTFAYVCGAILLLPLIIWRGAGVDFSAVRGSAWVSLFYMAAFPSVLCYLIFYYALTFIAASRLSAFSYVQPFLAMLLAFPLLGEPITSSAISGGALVLAGVYLTERG